MAAIEKVISIIIKLADPLILSGTFTHRNY